MGAGMTVGQQEQLGIVALAAVLYLKEQPKQGSSTAICSAVASLVPHMDEGFIRRIAYEVDSVLHALKKGEGEEWVELMTVLRRVDRP